MSMKRFLVLGSALLSFAARLGADGPFKFYSVAPCRIIDTRTPSGGGALADAETRGFLIATKCGIPSTAKLAALNFAVLSPSSGGNITAFPSNPTNLVPLVSTVNWTAGETAIANG